MRIFFQILLSIIVGAVIGYVTNYIAIKMLFRPYKKHFIFNKIPVPLTPGIIPKHRESIASKFGEMIGNVFLNEDTFKNKLSDPNTQIRIEEATSNIIEKAMTHEINTIESAIPEQHKLKLESAVSRLKSLLNTQAMSYIDSESFELSIRSFVDKEFNVLTQTKIKKLIDKENLQILINDILEDVLSNEGLHHNIMSSTEEYIDKLFDDERTLDEFLPEGTMNLVIIVSRKLVNILLPVFGDTVKNETVKDLLSEKIKDMLNQMVNEMNALQKMLVNMIRIKEIIDNEVPKLVERFSDEMKKTMRNRETKLRLNIAIKDYIKDMKTKTLSEVLQEIDKEQYDKVKENVKKAITDIIQNKNMIKTTIINYLGSLSDSISDKTIGEIMSGYSSDFNNNVKTSLTDFIIDFARSGAVKTRLESFIDTNINYIVYELKIGKVSDYIKMDDERKHSIVNFITDTSINLVLDQTSSILKAVKLQKMVEDKMNSLSVRMLEDVIIKVVKSELQYINIFGALLGGLIGSVNFLLNMFMSIAFG